MYIDIELNEHELHILNSGGFITLHLPEDVKLTLSKRLEETPNAQDKGENCRGI